MQKTLGLRINVRYNFAVGLVVSLFISLLASVPRILRLEGDYQETIINCLYLFGLSIGCWLIHQFMISCAFLWMPKKMIPQALVIIATGVLFSIVYHFAFINLVGVASISLVRFQIERRNAMLFFRSFMVSAVQFFIIYYLALIKSTERAKLENEQLKKENLQARLNALKEQISPHFLFNTLNTLSILTKEEKTKQYILELSNVYRYLLRYKENDLVSVSEELSFIQSYLYILNERFEKALVVNVNLSGDVLQSRIPPLALQILLENSIKHNSLSARKPLKIEISRDANFIVVSNDLQVKTSLPGGDSKRGLNNINERYRLLVNKEIDIEKSPDKFVVKLPILQ